MTEHIILRLTKEQYYKLVKDCGANTIVSSNTTDLQSAYQLGMQHVLNKLRDGFVVEVNP